MKTNRVWVVEGCRQGETLWRVWAVRFDLIDAEIEADRLGCFEERFQFRVTAYEPVKRGS